MLNSHTALSSACCFPRMSALSASETAAYFHSHILAQGLTGEDQRKHTGKQRPFSWDESWGSTDSPAPSLPGLPGDGESPCEVQRAAGRRKSLHLERHICLRYGFDCWKNRGLQRINESEISVLPFISSTIGLPKKGKINPRVHSESSGLTPPCVLKTVWLKIERNYLSALKNIKVGQAIGDQF